MLYLNQAFYMQLALLAGFWLSLHFNPEDGGSMFLRNFCWTGVTSQNTVLFKTCIPIDLMDLDTLKEEEIFIVTRDTVCSAGFYRVCTKSL
jgi:hypothetical protein